MIHSLLFSLSGVLGLHIGTLPKGEEPAQSTALVTLDRFGDSIPAGASTRMGTVRMRHGGIVRGVAFTPDGSLVASGSEDGTICIWEPITGKEVRRFEGHKGWVYAIALSPDGKYLASVSQDGSSLLWETATGKVAKQLPRNSGRYFVSVAFAPNGKILATGSSRELFLWDVQSGNLLHELRGHNGWVNSIAFSPDGTILASGSSDASVHFWDVASGRKRGQPLGHRSGVWSTIWSPDGRSVLSGADDGTITVWDALARIELRRWQAHPGRVLSLSVSPDGKTVASGGGGNMSVGLWEFSGGKELRQLHGHVNWVQAVCFSGDGNRLVTGGADRTVRVWNFVPGKEVSPRHGHQGPVSGVVLSPDAKTLATTSWDGSLRLWEVSTGRELSRMGDDQGARWAVAFVGKDGILAACVAPCKRPELRLWEAVSRQQLADPLTQGANPWAFAFAPKGDTLAVATENGSVQLWKIDKARKSRLLWDRAVGIKGGCLALSTDGKRLVLGGSTGPPTGAGWHMVWDVVTGVKLSQFAGRSRPVKCLAIAPDNLTLASGSFDGTIGLWDLVIGRESRSMKVAGDRRTVMCLTWSPDGKTIASGDSGGMVRLWEVATGKERCPPKKHQGPVTSVTFSRDGRLLATGCEDSTALVWVVDPLATGQAAPSMKLTDVDLERLWTDLSTDDPRTAYRAVWKLVSAPEQALSKLEGRIHAVAKVETQQMALLIGELDSDDFPTRQMAATELQKLGEFAEPALRRALTNQPSPELGRQAKDLLQKIQPLASGEPLRRWRALETLELIGQPARPLLLRLAKGEPEARLTREAAAALARLEESEGSQP